MSNTGIPLATAGQQPPDEDMLALLGLHPMQMQVAHGLASGAIHPQAVLDAATPKTPMGPASPSIGAPDATPPDIARLPDTEGIAAHPRTAPAAPAPVAPPPSLSGISPTPRIAPPVESVAAPTPLTEAEAKLQHDTESGSGLAQFQQRHPVLGTMARIGAGVGSAFFPSIAAMIPGTDLHHQVVLGQDRRAVGDVLGEQEKEALIAETGARTAHENAAAEAAANPKVGTTPEEATLHDLMTGENGQPRINPDTGKPYQYIEAFQKVYQAKQDAKPDKSIRTEKITRVVKGVPHEVLVNAETGEDIKDEGQTKIPGETPETKRSAVESAQVEREARQSIRKAEEAYRSTQKSVNQLTASIDAAKDGNGLLTSFVPTMAVLGINVSNGVHRISPAEAQAAQLPGGWAERFNAWFDKASEGKLSPQLQKEGKQLAGILRKSAYQQYKSTYDDESSMVEGYGGKDFSKRVKVIPDEEPKENADEDGGEPKPPREAAPGMKWQHRTNNGQVEWREVPVG